MAALARTCTAEGVAFFVEFEAKGREGIADLVRRGQEISDGGGEGTEEDGEGEDEGDETDDARGVGEGDGDGRGHWMVTLEEDSGGDRKGKKGRPLSGEWTRLCKQRKWCKEVCWFLVSLIMVELWCNGLRDDYFQPSLFLSERSAKDIMLGSSLTLRFAYWRKKYTGILWDRAMSFMDLYIEEICCGEAKLGDPSKSCATGLFCGLKPGARPTPPTRMC